MLGLIWILIILAVLIIIAFIGYYNRFAILNNRIDNSLAQIDVQLRKRADLIPNLINTVKGYKNYEKSVLTEVTKARTSFMNAKDFNGRMKAGNQIQSALKSIFAVAESYPQLKANENFLQLQQTLADIEDKVAYSRQYYNDSILSFNNSSKTFPANVFFNMFGFKEREYLQIPEETRAVPKVEF
jgi:LemA protein